MANLMPGEWDWMKGNPEDAAQQIDMQRRLRFAQALKEQSQQAPQGQMVGGIYVAPSWTQYASQALKGWHGAKEEQGAIQQMKDSAAARQQQRMEAAQRLAEALKGKTEESPMSYEESGGMPGMAQQVTRMPTPDEIVRAQLQYAQDIGDPSLMNGVMSTMANNAMEDTRWNRNRSAQIEDRAANWEHEDKNASRNRGWQIEDRNANQEFQRILQKDQQGFALTQQERQFAQQFQMQKQSQGFQAGQQARSQAFQAAQAAKNQEFEAGQNALKLSATQDKNKPLTESQGKAVLYGSRANEAHNILNGLDGKYSPMAINAQDAASNLWGVGGALGAIGNKALSSDSQRAMQAQRDFVNAVLRQESGATISPAEFESAKKQYFPQPGDTPAVIEQKRKNRETAINGFSTMSSGAFTPKYETKGNNHAEGKIRTVDW